MEPRFLNRGNIYDLVRADQPLLPSMEPRFLNRGNQVPPLRSISPRLRPSMEPRFLNRGNMIYAMLSPDKEYLQWSHGFSTVETNAWASCMLILPAAFNGATVSQPWKPWCPALSARNSGAFNGATVSQPWKLITELQAISRYLCPSMEPRFLNRGNRSW